MRAGKATVIIMTLLLTVFVVLSFIMPYVPELKFGKEAVEESTKNNQTVTRSETSAGNIRTAFYVDESGEKVMQSGGYKYQDGTYVSVDEKGNEIITFSRMMKKYPWLVFVIGILICAVGFLVKPRLRWVLLIAYTGFILVQTLAFRGANHGHLKLALFDSYKDFFSILTTRMEIINNYWLFLPFGALLYMIFKKKRVVLLATVLSIIIEVSQYVFDIGYCETDDVISNTIGAMLGVMMVCIFIKIKSGSNFPIEPGPSSLNA